MASRVALLLIAASICLGFAAAFSEVPVDCCLVTTDKPFPRRFRILSFLLQTTDRGCEIDATVFITKNGLRLCTPHPSQSRWVADYINRIEQNNRLQRAVAPEQ